MLKRIALVIVAFAIMMGVAGAAKVVQPSFNPAYDPYPGKQDSLIITCDRSDKTGQTLRFRFQPWTFEHDASSQAGWLAIEDSEGDSDIFQRGWHYGESVSLPNRTGLTVVYYSGGVFRYDIIPGQCAEEDEPTSTTTTAPTEPTSTTEPPTPTTTAPPEDSTTTTTGPPTPPTTEGEPPWVMPLPNTTLPPEATGAPLSVGRATVAGVTPLALADAAQGDTGPRQGLLAVTGSEAILFSLLAGLSLLAVGTPMALYFRNRANG